MYPRTAVLTVLIGPPGAGKTHWAMGGETEYELQASDLDIHFTHVISTDQIRQDLCGNFRDQRKNSEVYRAFYLIAIARLTSGLPVVLDATHLDKQARLNSLSLLPDGYRRRTVVLDRPMEEKLEQAEWRSPEFLQEQQEKFDKSVEDIIKADGEKHVAVFDMRRRLP